MFNINYMNVAKYFAVFVCASFAIFMSVVAFVLVRGGEMQSASSAGFVAFVAAILGLLAFRNLYRNRPASSAPKTEGEKSASNYMYRNGILQGVLWSLILYQFSTAGSPHYVLLLSLVIAAGIVNEAHRICNQ